MSKDFGHAGNEHDNIFLIEGFFAGREVGLEIGDSLLHLDVAFLAVVHMSSLFLDGVAALILYDVGMRVDFDFRKQFNFFPEDELCLFVVKSNFLDALDVVLFIDDFIDNAVAGSDDLFELEPFVEFSISIKKLHCFIAHFL